ncbi:MAG: O-antigen ligase family protein [Acidobacteria bacterium]|nr:O-antigen ligase family protein [Acidobacteriota bacterium]
MKSKQTRAVQQARFQPAELLFLFLPLIALTPNFFVIPELGFTGLATQEFVFGLAVVAFAAACLARALQLPAGIKLGRQQLLLLAPLAAFCLWQLLSLLWTPDWSEGVRLAGIWFGLALFFVTGRWALSERSIWPLYSAILVATALLLWSLFYEYFVFGSGEMWGIFFNHGITAELLALLLPVFLMTFLCERQHRFFVVAGLIAAGLSAVALMLTLRRGPLLGVSLAGLCITVALAGKVIRAADNRRVYAIAGAVLLVVVPLGLYKREALLARWRGATQLQTARNTQSIDLGLTGRTVTWLTAWEMGKRNILQGVGAGGYEASYGAYKKFFAENPRYAAIAAAAGTEDYDEIHSPRAHGEYLQMFAEVGLAGLLLFAVFWLQVARQLWRRRHAPRGYLALGALFSLFSFAACSIVTAFSFRSTPGVLLLSCVLALGFAVQPEEADENDAGWLMPKVLVSSLAALALVAALAILARNYNVYASQQMQSGLDFKFALNNAAENERLVRRYRQVLDLDPANAGAHLGLSLVLFQMKRPQECLPHIEYALAHGYSRPYAYILWAFCYEQNGDVSKAGQILQECLASFPKSIVARAAYAEMLRKQGQFEQAKQQRERLEKVDAQLARSWDLAFRMKDAAAADAAKQAGLLAPGELEPKLVRTLVQARAYHYLK